MEEKDLRRKGFMFPDKIRISPIYNREDLCIATFVQVIHHFKPLNFCNEKALIQKVEKVAGYRIIRLAIKLYRDLALEYGKYILQRTQDGELQEFIPKPRVEPIQRKGWVEN